MTTKFNINQKIGEIATIFPKSTELFMEYGIDFCCGGNRTLDEALKEKGLNPDYFMEKLNAFYTEFKGSLNDETDWTKVSAIDLIDYIVDKHHTFMRDELPITGELLNKILKVHYVDHGSLLSKLHKLFSNLKAEIESHLVKEEELLFPLIKEYEKNQNTNKLKEIYKVMKETEDEHDSAGDILKEMRRLTGNYTVPTTGCNSFKLTYEKLQAIEKDLFNHIHLENNVLFPKLKK